MTRIHTSGPDQAYRQAVTAWQRERMGPVHPAGPEPLRWWRIAGTTLGMAVVLAIPLSFMYL